METHFRAKAVSALESGLDATAIATELTNSFLTDVMFLHVVL